MSKSKNRSSSDDKLNLESVNKRLDALIRIMLEMHLDKNNKFNLTAAVKALNSCGLGRVDIATILGKKPTDVDPLLYSKPNKRKKRVANTQQAIQVERKDDV